MTHTSRSTDRGFTSYERNDRLYLQAGLWYFRTREGSPIGPFRYRHEAESMLTRFLEQVRDNEQKMQTRSLKRKPHFRIAAAS